MWNLLRTTLGHLFTWKSSMRQMTTPALWPQSRHAGSVEATCFRRALYSSVPMPAQLAFCRGTLSPSHFSLETRYAPCIEVRLRQLGVREVLGAAKAQPVEVVGDLRNQI